MNTEIEHWNQIFSAKADPEVGWYESDARQTLKFIQDVPRLESATVFIPGAGTSVLVHELLPICQYLILNDISAAALNILKGKIKIENNRTLQNISRWCVREARLVYQSIGNDNKRMHATPPVKFSIFVCTR